MTDPDALAIDTSVVVPALLSWHEHHERARVVLRAALASPGTLVVPVPVLVEAYAVLTRLPPPWRMGPDDAHRLLSQTFRGRATLSALDGQGAWDLLDALRARGIAGGATFDAQVAACARHAGVKRIATFNRKDFYKFEAEDLDVIVP